MLMPWRNSHWQAQKFAGNPQVMKNGADPVSAFPGRVMELQNALANKATGIPVPLQASMPSAVPNDGAFSHTLTRQASDAQSTKCPANTDTLNPKEELTIEGGKINVSSVYSQELLNSLTQALQSSGVDLSQASISVQINLGKQGNLEPTSGVSIAKDHETSIPTAGHFQDVSNSKDLDQSQKRLKI